MYQIRNLFFCFVAFGGIFVLQRVIEKVINLTSMDYFSNSGFITSLLSYALIVIPVYGIWYQNHFHGIRKSYRKKLANPRLLLGLLGLAVSMQFATFYILIIIDAFMPGHQNLMNSNPPGFLEIGFQDQVWTVFAVLAAPLCEELIFRGVILGHARKALPFWAANLFQAMLFGIYHMNVRQGIYTFCMGLIFGYICYKGNVLMSMLLHFLYNLYAAVFPGQVMVGVEYPVFFWAWLLIAFFLSVLAFYVTTSEIREKNSIRSRYD